MTSVDIFWTDGTFTTVQNVETIEAALAKCNASPRSKHADIGMVLRHVIVADDAETQFAKMFRD